MVTLSILATIEKFYLSKDNYLEAKFRAETKYRQFIYAILAFKLLPNLEFSECRISAEYNTIHTSSSLSSSSTLYS